jgi:acetolactate synthase regulatory subunit
LTHQLFTITGTRGPQLLPQLFGLIVHRQTVLLSCHACRLGDEMQVQLLVDLPDDAGAELLHRRLDRIVDVVKTVHSLRLPVISFAPCWCVSTATLTRAARSPTSPARFERKSLRSGPSA